MNLLCGTRMHSVCHQSGKGVSAGKTLTVAFVLAFAVAGLVTLPTVEPTQECSPSGVADALRMTSLATIAQGETPKADAGGNRTAFVGAIVSFDGSDSTDDFGIVNYTWTVEDDGVHTLYGAVVNYTFWTAGNFTVSLNVTDDDGHWDTDVINVAVVPDTEPPVARGGNRIVLVGTLVPLNATLSTDNARIVNYTWEFEYDREDLVLFGEVAPFWFNRSGTYDILLTVTDASGWTNSTTVIVQVNKEATWLSENWFRLTATVIILAVATWVSVTRYRKNKALVTKTDIEKLHLQLKNSKKVWSIFRANRIGMTGFIALWIFVVIALAAPWLSTVRDPNVSDNFEPNVHADEWVNPLPPSMTPSPYTDQLHPLGTDHKGGDIWSLTMYGARASLIVGLVAAGISAVMGALIGLAAGYFSRMADEVLMRATDFFLVLPWFPLMIVMMAILGRDFIWIIVVIGITSWPSTARIVRAQVLTVKERQFIERARAIGAGDSHIIVKHIMPNVMPLIFANTVLLISLAIFSEAFLDFFGLGDPDVISWGAMLEGAYHFGAFYQGAWWYILPPGLCILGMVLSFSLVGYALDDILNPKLRRR
ncbi:MAG: ABC transporter permease subunit [Methanobacteriota archaeon]|nr:MAG: ABC transporter permease subunit [Euryarchaeota archaeon]